MRHFNMAAILFLIIGMATASQAGMFFARVDSTEYGRAWDSALWDNAAGAAFGWRNAAGIPVMTDHNYAITYTRNSDGVIFACPGNGDPLITQAFIDLFISGYGFTSDDVFYREQGDTRGLTRVVPTIE